MHKGDGRDALSGNSHGTPLSIALLSIATFLARRGEYAAAEGLLKYLLNRDRGNTRVWDLLARIYAQQGRFSEAEEAWRCGLKIDPGNKIYLAGIERIFKKRNRNIYTGTLTPVIGILVAMLVTYLALFIVKNRIVHFCELLVEEVSKVKIESELKGKIVKAEGLQTFPQIMIQIDGVYVKKEQNCLVIYFDEGLFSYGTLLKPDTKNLLTELGRQLEPYSSNISIRIIGHTDDIPVPKWSVYYRNNEELGMARANIVANYISQVAAIPLTLFQLQTAGDSCPPYPNNTLFNRLRNRTVVIYISNIEGSSKKRNAGNSN